jgi:hypothetical protein
MASKFALIYKIAYTKMLDETFKRSTKSLFFNLTDSI